MNNLLAVTLVVALVASFGCGKSQTYESSDGSVTVKEDSGTSTIQVKSRDGTTTTTMAASDSGVAIPSTFPKDVPILEGGVPQMTMTQGKTELLHLLFPGSVAEVAKAYGEKLKEQGWEIQSSMNMGDSSVIHAKKDTRQCAAVMLKDDAGTVVQLSVAEE